MAYSWQKTPVAGDKLTYDLFNELKSVANFVTTNHCATNYSGNNASRCTYDSANYASNYGANYPTNLLSNYTAYYPTNQSPVYSGDNDRFGAADADDFNNNNYLAVTVEGSLKRGNKDQ